MTEQRLFYTGVGDHHVEVVPTQKLDEATSIARNLEGLGLILRSGGATGFDQAFERGVVNPANKIIYLSARDQRYPDDLWNEAVKLVLNTHGNPQAAKRYIHLLARNVFQVLGDDLQTPSKFVVCWTKNGQDIGGTGTTIRIAHKFSVPVYNMYSRDTPEILGKIRTLIGVYS
jgi:hypothetical protein